MPHWLKYALILKGHILLWIAALIGVFWLILVLTLQFLGERPQSLYTVAAWAGVKLEMGSFEAKTSFLASSVTISLEKVHLKWHGGQLDLDYFEGDIRLLNLLSPDLAVGQKMRAQNLVLVLETDEQESTAHNPLANPWLRLWEDTQINDAKIIWQAKSPWMMDAIHLNVMRKTNWQAAFSGIMHYPNWPATPVVAEATITHQFGFHPKIQFEGMALPGDMVLLGQQYDFKFVLQGKWDEEDLHADLTIDARSKTTQNNYVDHHVLGKIYSDDLIMWDVSVQQLSIGGEKIDLPVWPRLSLHPQTGAILTLNQVRLTSKGSWLTSMPESLQKSWRLWQPELWLNQLSLHWNAQGTLETIRGGIDLLRWTPAEGIASMDLRQLTFDYQPKDGRLEVVPLSESKIVWQFSDGHSLPVSADPLVLRLDPENPFTHFSIPSWQVGVGDVSVSVLADVHPDKQTRLQVAFKAKKITDIISLLPMEQFSLPLQNWLHQALKEGTDVEGSVNFHGELAQLLSGQINDTNFSAMAQAKEVSLLYDKDYPPLTHADAKLSWQNNALVIESKRASIGGGEAESIKAEVLFLPNEQIALRLNGVFRADLAQVQAFLLDSPLAKLTGTVAPLKMAVLSGAASGQLSLWLPLDGFTGVDSLPLVRGMVKMQDAALNYDVLQVNHVTGQIAFSESGIEAPKLVGQWQEGEIQASVSSLDKGRTGIKLLASTAVNYPMISEGILNWRADVVIAKEGSINLIANGNQKQLVILLPEPFHKPLTKENNWQLQVNLTEGIARVNFKDVRWSADFSVDIHTPQWQLQGGSLVPTNATNKLRNSAIDIQLPSLALTSWLNWLEQRSNTSAKTSILPKEGSFYITSLTLGDQKFDDVKGGWYTNNAVGNIAFSAPHLVGKLDWTDKEAQLHLDKLHWQRKIKTAAEKLTDTLPYCAKPTSNPWQPLQIDIDKVNLETYRQGIKTDTILTDITAKLMQEGQIRQIKDIHFQSGSVKADSGWTWNIAENKSTLFFNARADKAADIMAIWGLENSVAGGSTDISSTLMWDGGLDCLDMRLVEGNVVFRADDGALSDTSPGLARLFGLLSFDAFTRRLKIGLGDVVNKGLAYDKVEASAELSKGILHVNKLQLDGPSVRMVLGGNTDLIAEEHELDAQVTPLIGDSIPTMALLSGVSPITAIGVYLLQKIVPPLSGNLFTFDYHITGSWQEPVLVEVVAQ